MTSLQFMPHQQKALDQTEAFNRCAYYLDMGLGKTFVGAEKIRRKIQAEKHRVFAAWSCHMHAA